MRKPNDLTDEIKVLPVAVIHSAGETKPTLEALRDGGIPAAEITFRTPCAAEAIRIGCKAFPDMHIGAGTVINTEQARTAIAAGAEFVVSPGLSAGVAEVCRAAGVPYYPGCVTRPKLRRRWDFASRTSRSFLRMSTAAWQA